MKAAGIGGLWPRPIVPLLFSSIFLAGCATAPPLSIGNTNPANPAAERGFSEAPAALDSYKSSADFAARSNEPAGTMEGMSHGAMPGMSGGKMDGGSTDNSAQTPAPKSDKDMVMPSDENKKSGQPGGAP